MEEQKTNEAKDLLFIATWAIPLGMITAFILEMTYMYLSHSNLLHEMVRAYINFMGNSGM